MKKTIYLMLMAFLILLGCSKVNDGLNVNPNENQLKSASTNKVLTAHRWTSVDEFSLWCGDKEIDYGIGSDDVHCVMQYENDVLLFMNMTFHGSFTGQNTGEVFRYYQEYKYNLSKGDDSYHFNVIGDKGSHYIVSARFLAVEPWIVIDKAICK